MKTVKVLERGRRDGVKGRGVEGKGWRRGGLHRGRESERGGEGMGERESWLRENAVIGGGVEVFG